LWDILFINVPANVALLNSSDVETNFKAGGYFSWELSNDLIVICINGMYPFFENT
jgi:hypothetical protein